MDGLKLSRYSYPNLTKSRFIRKNLSSTQVLVILICLISLVSIISTTIGPFYEKQSAAIPTHHHDKAFSHRLFPALASILTLVLGSAMFVVLHKRKAGATDVVSPLDAVHKVLLPDEQKIVEILEKEGGTITQIKLSRRAGLSRVKVHRNVHRLAEKNIVTIMPAGRTNLITLTEWLKPDAEKE